jgi:hypothetical protein
MRENRIIESKESMPLDRLTATLAISGPVFIGVASTVLGILSAGPKKSVPLN